MNEGLIEQLVGTYEEYDEIDMFIWHFMGCSKFDGKSVAIDFETGVLQVYNEEGTLVKKTYKINATLEEVK